ncbi:hypothetical protein J6590_067976 [Homalodisca vitripennis]|nr:hypothetical protein J6590_067976 [Homalodisca vitripennis]
MTEINALSLPHGSRQEVVLPPTLPMQNILSPRKQQKAVKHLQYPCQSPRSRYCPAVMGHCITITVINGRASAAVMS